VGCHAGFECSCAYVSVVCEKKAPYANSPAKKIPTRIVPTFFSGSGWAIVGLHLTIHYVEWHITPINSNFSVIFGLSFGHT
jgi:hypothetical protein